MNDLVLNDEAKALHRSGSDLAGQADKVVINSPEDLVVVDDMLGQALEFQREVKRVMDPICKSAHDAHKQATLAKKDCLAPFVRVEQILKPKVVAYNRKVEAERKAKERELEKKQLEEAEAQRIKEAEEVEARGGSQAEVNDALHAPVETVPVVLPEDKPEMKNVGTIRQVWKFRIDDPAKLPREFLMPDEKRLGSLARSMKSDAKVDGVTFYADETPTMKRS